MCQCTRLRPCILLFARSRRSLPFPGGCAGAARPRPPGLEKAEAAMATIPREAPGRIRVGPEEATRSSHRILTTTQTIGILLHDIGLLTQVHIPQDQNCKARV